MRAGGKRNSSGDVRGIANHSSAETKLARFRERWCHPISTNERPGRRRRIGEGKKPGEEEEWSKKKERKRK